MKKQRRTVRRSPSNVQLPTFVEGKVDFSQRFTVNNQLFGKAPARLQLFGDKTRKIESASHIIEFPGGAIELSRTSAGDYWAHVLVNREFADNDCKGLCNSFGDVIAARISASDGVHAFPAHPEITQFAILIRPSRQKPASSK